MTEALEALGLDSEAEKLRRWLEPQSGPPPRLRAALEREEADLRGSDDAASRTRRLRALVSLARFGEASRVFEGEVPAGAAAWAAEADIQTGLIDRALERLRAGSGWTCLCLEGLARLAAGDADGAADRLRAASDAAGGEAMGRALLALVAQQRGDPEAAWSLASEAVALRPGAGWPLAVRALVSQARTDFIQAGRDLDAAAALEPAGWIFHHRAVCNERAGQMDAALADAERAIEHSLPHPALLVHRGHLLLHRKQYPRAVEAFSEAVRLAPHDPVPYWRRANAHWLGGDLERAAADADACVRLEPGSLEYRMGMVRFALLRGRDGAARAELRRWLRSGSADLAAAARFLSGVLHFRKGRFRCAAAQFDEAERRVRSGEASRKFMDVGYSSVARGMRFLKDKGVSMSKLGGNAAAADGGKGVLVLSGLGLSYPVQATLEVLNVLSGCDTIFSNLAGADAMEFLTLFCADVRTVSYEGRFDEQVWVDKVFSATGPGKKVAFVTRGHPLVSGKLASELLGRARLEGVEVQSYGAISTVDTIIALAEEVLSVTFMGLQVLDSRLLIAGQAQIQPQLPMILYLGIEYGAAQPRMSGYIGQVVGLLKARYPAGYTFLLHGPRYDSRKLEPVVLEQLESRLSSVALDMLSSIIVFAPPIGHRYAAERPGQSASAAAPTTA